ncbi:MAG: ATP-binding protein [Candidatus Pacebacteria bacterium]|nr:ATP-binding protein [Candidatus Paceibacterota bacterium]
MNNLLFEIVLRQKKVLENDLKKEYVPRTIFEKAEKLINNTLIKVVVGPRRVGKSILLMLLIKKAPFMFLNFDDESLLPELRRIKKYDDILDVLIAVYGNTKTVVFDEIQNLENWELFVNRLHREGYNVFVTGSNARLLSGELATHLTGRYSQIEVFPFDFKEYLMAKNVNFEDSSKGEFLNFSRDYMINGGYPEVVLKNLDPSYYLSTLFDATLLKDVIMRQKIRLSEQKFINLGSYAINNFTGEFSYTSLKDFVEIKSVETIQKYLKSLEDSYIIFQLNRFSNKEKERVKSPKKFYIVDNGFVLSKSVRISDDYGKYMENLVFSELLKRGFKPNNDLFYYKTKNNKEVDFLIKNKTGSNSLIQVCYDISSQKTEEREISALISASSEISYDSLLLITWNEERTETIKEKTIQYIPLWKWLLK